MALQGAAGVAMHLGAGEQALTLAEQVIERNASTGTTQDEAYVLLALAHCQLGDVDEAMAAIEQVDGRRLPVRARRRGPSCGPSPASATARSADAEAVEAMRGASYFDLALGRLAGVLAAAAAATTRRGRHWLEQLGTLASSVGDVVFVAVAQLPPRPRRRATTTEAAAAGPGLAPHRRPRRRRLTRPIGAFDAIRVPGARTPALGTARDGSGPPSLRRRVGRFGYQPALDGVRALAVAMVLLFHQGWLAAATSACRCSSRCRAT